jgi:hypothetical protein
MLILDVYKFFYYIKNYQFNKFRYLINIQVQL